MSKKATLTRSAMNAVSLILAAALVVCIAAPFAYAEESEPSAATLPALDSGINTSMKAQVESKGEVIYALLDYDGVEDEAYVVNRFRVGTEGSFIDYGAYSSLENLTNTEPISSNGNEVTLAAAEGDFYYQGTMEDPVMPWQISIAYSLDGKEIASSEVFSLGGKSGELGIRITTKATPGIDESFYEHYNLQISVTLPTESISNLVAEGSTVASAGSDTQVSFVALPGSEGDFELTVDFEGINMPGISLAAVPFGMEFDLPDTSGMASQLTTLANSIAEVATNTQRISDGLAQAASGVESLSSGFNYMNSNLVEISGGSGDLAASSEALSTNLTTTASALQSFRILIEMSQDIAEPQKSQLLATIDGLSGISDGYTQLNTGIQGYTGGVSAIAPGYSEAGDGLAQSAYGIRELSNGLAQLSAGTTQLSTGTQSMPEEMQKQIDEFAASYDFGGFEPRSFISEKNENVELVQFVMTTPAIELPAEEEPEEDNTQESSILDKLIALFTGE